MPLMPLNRQPIRALRQELDAALADIGRARVAAAQARREVADAKQRGASPAEQARLAQAGATAAVALREQADRRARLLSDIVSASQAFTVGVRNEALVESLEGEVPIALLPVRLETRYLEAGARLAIRIYPDTLHVLRHLRGLTDAERDGGAEYWGFVAEGQGREEAVWRRLVATYRAPRAQFILRATHPANDAVTESSDALARRAVAMLMPDRFCAVGYASGRQEVFRVWADVAVPDLLPMAPELDPALVDEAAAEKTVFGEDGRWMTEYAEALKKGMAIDVRADNLRNGFQLHMPLERLVVFGVDWTLGAEDSAAALESLLEAHAHSHGLSCIPLGTATNQTGRGHSDPAVQAPPPQPAALAPGESDAHDLLCQALGFSGALLTPELLPGAGLSEQRTQMHMVNALWRGTFGRYLDQMWNTSLVDGTEYVTDRAIGLARDFAVGWLRPGGPLPLLRVGKQPYGVLPVLGRYVPDGETEDGIHKVIGLLRPAWRDASTRAPRIDGQSLDQVRELIQTGPWSAVAQFRNIEPPNKSVKVMGIASVYGEVQINSKSPLVLQLLKAFGVDLKVEVTLQTSTHDVAAHDLGRVPWVQADKDDPKKPRSPELPLDPPYIAQIEAALGGGGQAKAQLSPLQKNSASLLQGLLAFSAEEEFDRAGSSLVGAAVASAVSPAVLSQLTLSRSTPSMVAVAPVMSNPAWLEVENTRQIADLRLPGLTGGQTVEAHLSQALATSVLPDFAVSAVDLPRRVFDFEVALPAPWRQVASVRASLRALAPLTVGELDTAFRLTLDAFSYRLDAWATALASKRLDAVRRARAARQQPAGLYVGAWGAVEGLRRDTTPDSLGYTHAPSITQAVTAAMLRSGYLANAERGGEAFNINLDSARVQRARSLIEGMERGQSPAALLGYRFERALRESTDFVLAKYILDFRRRFPLRPAGPRQSDEPAESIAARDVVDGMALLDAWAKNEAPLLADVTLADRPPLRDVLRDLAGTWDAVCDVMVAESVYQLAQNNLERSAAASAAIDALGPAQAPQVTQTPRARVSYAQRLVGLCPGEDMPNAWAQAVAACPLHAAEPRLGAWLAQMLGDPARFALRVQRVRNDAIDGAPLVLSAADLQRSPLAVVLGARPATDTATPASGDANTPLRGWLVQALQRLVPAEPGLRLDILPTNDDGSPGLAAFEALAATLNTLVSGARPLARHDLVVPVDALEAGEAAQGAYAGVDAAEIAARADAAWARLEAADAALAAAGNDAGLIATALANCWPFGLRGSQAHPEPQGASADALARWRADESARRDRVRLEIGERRARALALPPTVEQAPDPVTGVRPAPVPRPPTVAEAVGIALERIRLVFGKNFPVLPRFTLGPYAAAVAASAADRAALTGGDAFAVAGWLPQLARVREGADRLNAALSAHEALHPASLHDSLALWQLPHQAGKAWAALPACWAGQQPRKVVPQLALVGCTAGQALALQADSTLAGFAIEEWQEAVPERVQTTGLAMHYDAPGARPPQAVLLAVPPSIGAENWRFEDLLACIHEALDWAELRAVRPKDLHAGLGALLPANYLPQHKGDSVPSVELWKMAKDFAAHSPGVVALGKI